MEDLNLYLKDVLTERPQWVKGRFSDPLLGYVGLYIILFIFANTTTKIRIFHDNSKQIIVKVDSYQQ